MTQVYVHNSTRKNNLNQNLNQCLLLEEIVSFSIFSIKKNGIPKESKAQQN
jgi:hypothetical protein